MKITEFRSIWIISLLAVFSTEAQAQGITGIFVRKVPVRVPAIDSRPNPKLNLGSPGQSTLLKKTRGIAAVNTAETVTTKNGCPEGFTSFADSCFLEGVIPETWETAKGICKQAGGDLATINSKEEYKFIRREFGNELKEQMWIGLSKQTPGTPYTWANGERVRYLPWTLNYTGQEPTGYVALSLNSIEFFPKSNPKTPLPFLCGTKRVPDTASATAAAGGAVAAVGGAAAAAAGSASLAEQHKVMDVRAADITQVGWDAKARPEETMLTCKEGWERFEDKCFKAFYEQATFQNASLRCRKEGGELLSLHSPSQSEFVRTKVLKDSPSQDFWIGLSSGINGLQWSDGSPLDYSNWTPGMSTSQILTPFRTLNPQRKDISKHLEKCFSLNSETSRWANIKCDGEKCYICYDDEDTPEGAAAPATDLQGSTTSAPTSPGSTQKTSTLRSDVFIVDPEKIVGPGKPIEKPPHHLQNGFPRHLQNGAIRTLQNSVPITVENDLPRNMMKGLSAISLLNVSKINMTRRVMISKRGPDSAANSRYEDDDDQDTVNLLLGAAAAVAALAGATIGVIKLRRRYVTSPSSWTSLPNSSRENVHSLESVHQSLRDPETCDENQRGVYGAME